MARPRKPIDPRQVEALATIQCTDEEIALVVGVTVEELREEFAALIEAGRQKGAMSLRRKQYEMAKDGNVQMLIWLGKQVLGQSDGKEAANPTTEALRLMRG